MKYKKILMPLFLISISVIGFFLGRYLMYEAAEYMKITTGPNLIASSYTSLDNYEQTLEHTAYAHKITPATMIVQRHVDSRTGQTTETLNRAAASLQGLTEEQLNTFFDEWSVLSFSENEVIIQRIIESMQQPSYKLSIFHGFLAIFNIDGRLLEVTNIPTSHLATEEIERLTHGIFIADEDELIRRLEDYSS
ncbi:MAG: hypothetical protein FWF50_01185 [Defluviitaleaceae bacterium]|nr:hypothetical protein [Defluviitaleaceae bacterium]